MKKLLFVLLVLSVFAVNAQVPSYVPTNGLVAYYPFNGNANDASGNGNNGVPLNGALLTNDRNGNINSAYSFDGVDDRIFINNNFFNNGWSSFTISGWLYLNNQQNPNNSASSHIIFNTSPHNGLGSAMNWGASNKYSISVGTGSPSTSWNLIFDARSNQNITVNNWKFTTLIKNNNNYYFYVDGILDQTWTVTSSVQSYLYKLYLGGCDPLNSNEVLNGKLDDIAIYNRALTQQEVTQLYTGQVIPSYVPTNGLVGYWPFNGNANDASGNGNNGVVNGATLTTDRFGDVGKAYSFDGVSNYIVVPNSTSFNNTTWSISAWVNPNGYYNGVEKANFMVSKGTDFNNGHYNLHFRSITKKARASIGIGTSTTQYVDNLSDINLNQWKFLTATWDGVNLRIYTNGVLENTTSISSNVQGINNENLFFGTMAANSSFPYWLNGKLDDIAIYNRALSSQEVSNLYSSSAPCIANITNNDTTICKGQSVTLNAAAVTPASVTDINGNVYPSVNIGAQTWSSKNLNVSKYKNGDIIPQVTDSAAWRNLTTGAWCWYNNDSANYASKGKLYNWYAVNDSRGIAPDGWHVPTDGEWNKMIKFLDPLADTVCGGCAQSTTAGGALKQTGTTNWASPNNAATNASGFNAIASGIRDGRFLNPTINAYWWTTTTNAANTTPAAWSHAIGSSDGNEARISNVKYNGYSVRVVRNATTYLWSTGATTQTITVSPTVTTTYYVTINNGFTTCTDSVKVTVSTITTNLITADTIKVCGTSTTISATTGLASYAWSNGANTASTTVTSSGWYKCTATNGACTSIDSVYVSLFNPKITQNDTTVCAGTAIQLNVVGDSINSNRFFIRRIGLSPYAYVNANEWNYISITKDINRNTNVYFNGQLVSTGTFSNEAFNHIILYIGASYYTSFGEFFKGWLDELRISNRARTSTEILSYYNQNLPFLNDSSTIALWRFNENSGNTFLNELGGSGTLFNGALFQSGKFGNAVYFDGINDYGNCNFNMIENNYTIDAWVKLDGNVPLGFERNYIQPYGTYNTETGFKGERKAQYTSVLWSTGATTQSITVNPTATTSYIATVSNGINTCKDTVKITVIPFTTNLITADTVKVCGTSTIISATTGLASYAWSNGANTASTTVTSSGWYKCTATNGACTAIDSVYVSLFNPKITQNDTTVCAGASLTLSLSSVNTTSVTDINGNVYPTVNIGTQTWMQKNLNVSKYKNGDIIPKVENATQWTALTTGAWCWYNNDSATYAATYGKLYNWYAVNDPRGLAPNGWHVPTGLEWDSLSYFVTGNITTAGGPLKEAGTTHWFSPNVGATNSSNFNGLPGGYRANQDATGEFYGLGSDGWFFASGNLPAFKNLYYGNNGINPTVGFGYYNYFSNTTGASVRLKKDVSIPFATPYTYLWSTGATTPSITVAPTATTSYIATVSNGINTCKDTVKITVANITSLAPTTIYGAVDVCSAIGTDTASVPVNYKINKIANAASYVWTVPAGVTLLSGQGDTSIMVRFSASFVSGAITVKSVSTCNVSSAVKSVTVYKRVAAAPTAIQKEFTPTSIVATTNVSGLVSEVYRIKKVTYATSYNWYLNRGTNASITHINASGENDTAVIVTFASCFVKDTLSVKSVTPCSISAAKTVIMSSSTTPTTVAGIGTAGGDFSVCIGSSKTFTAIASTPTTAQVGIASFRWTKPLNTTITSATSDSSSITLSFNAGFTGGSITAKGVSSCGVIGTVATSAILQYLPPTPLSISASTNSYNACINSSVTYTAIVGAPTTAQAPASLFRWTRPNNTTITSASVDSSSITVRFNTGYTGGVISVKGQSRCGTQSAARSQALTHTGCALGTKTTLPITTTNTASFEVSLYPNPTTNEFKLLIKNNTVIGSNKPSKAIIKVIDVQGRMMKSFITNTNQVTAIGNELKSGVYMVEVRMGDEVKVIRAVKF